MSSSSSAYSAVSSLESPDDDINDHRHNHHSHHNIDNGDGMAGAPNRIELARVTSKSRFGRGLNGNGFSLNNYDGGKEHNAHMY